MHVCVLTSIDAQPRFFYNMLFSLCEYLIWNHIHNAITRSVKSLQIPISNICSVLLPLMNTVCVWGEGWLRECVLVMSNDVDLNHSRSCDIIRPQPQRDLLQFSERSGPRALPRTISCLLLFTSVCQTATVGASLLGPHSAALASLCTSFVCECVCLCVCVTVYKGVYVCLCVKTYPIEGFFLEVCT